MLQKRRSSYTYFQPLYITYNLPYSRSIDEIRRIENHLLSCFFFESSRSSLLSDRRTHLEFISHTSTVEHEIDKLFRRVRVPWTVSFERGISHIVN